MGNRACALPGNPRLPAPPGLTTRWQCCHSLGGSPAARPGLGVTPCFHPPVRRVHELLVFDLQSALPPESQRRQRPRRKLAGALTSPRATPAERQVARWEHAGGPRTGVRSPGRGAAGPHVSAGAGQTALPGGGGGRARVRGVCDVNIPSGARCARTGLGPGPAWRPGRPAQGAGSGPHARCLGNGCKWSPAWGPGMRGAGRKVTDGGFPTTDARNSQCGALGRGARPGRSWAGAEGTVIRDAW